MMFLKRIFIFIVLFIITCVLGIIFLCKSYFGLRIIFYCSCYFMPELKVNEISGTLNDFVLKKIKYSSKNILILIEELHVNLNFFIFKNIHINVNHLVLKDVSISFCNQRIFSKSKEIKWLVSLKKWFISHLSIFFKNINVCHFIGRTSHLKFLIDFYSGSAFWNNNNLSLSTSKVNVFSIKGFQSIVSLKNFDSKFDSRLYSVFLKNFFKKFLQYLKKTHVCNFINFNCNNFLVEKIYFCDYKNILISNFDITVNILDKKIVIKKVHCVFGKCLISILGYMDIDKNYIYLTLTINKNHSLNSFFNFKVVVQGLFFSTLQLDIISNSYKIHLSMLLRTVVYPKKLICNFKLIVLKKNHNGINLQWLFSSRIHLIIFKNMSSEYTVKLKVSFYNKYLQLVKFYLITKGDYNDVFIKSINFQMFYNKKIYNYKWKYFSDDDYLQNKFFKNINNFKVIKYFISDFRSKFLEFIKYKLFNIKKEYFVWQIIKSRIKVFGTFYVNKITNNDLFSIDIVLGCNKIFIYSNTVNSLINLHVFFKIDNLNDIFPMLNGRFSGNIKFQEYSVNDDYILTCKVKGTHLDFNLFKFLHLKYQMYLDKKNFYIEMLLEKILFFKNWYVSSINIVIQQKYKNNYVLFSYRSKNIIFVLVYDQKNNINSLVRFNFYNSWYFIKFFVKLNQNRIFSLLFSKFFFKILTIIDISRKHLFTSYIPNILKKILSVLKDFQKNCFDKLYNMSNFYHNVDIDLKLLSKFKLILSLNNKKNYNLYFLIKMISGNSLKNSSLELKNNKFMLNRHNSISGLLNFNDFNFFGKYFSLYKNKVFLVSKNVFKYKSDIHYIVELNNLYFSSFIINNLVLKEKLCLKNVVFYIHKEYVEFSCNVQVKHHLCIFLKFNYFYFFDLNYKKMNKFVTLIYKLQCKILMLDINYLFKIVKIFSFLFNKGDESHISVFFLKKFFLVNIKILIDKNSNIFFKFLGMKINIAKLFIIAKFFMYKIYFLKSTKDYYYNIVIFFT